MIADVTSRCPLLTYTALTRLSRGHSVNCPTCRFDPLPKPTILPLTRAYAQVYPAAPRSEAELRYADGRYTPPYQHARWVADVAGTLWGWCEYSQHPSWYHPDQYEIALSVLPDAQGQNAQGQGVDHALYEQLSTALAQRRPQALRTNVLETHTRQLDFFTRQGFAETQRSWHATLDLGTFSAEPFAEVADAAARDGFWVESVAAVEADETRLPGLYTFYQELVADLPRTQSYTPLELRAVCHPPPHLAAALTGGQLRRGS